MMLIVLLTLIMSLNIHAQDMAPLSLYKETAHVKLYCTPPDEHVATLLFKQSCDLLKQLASDFNHHYPTHLTLNIYPDIDSFHHAIGWPDAPHWVIGSTYAHTSLIVSPENPGSYHSYENVVRSNSANIIALFIIDAYKNTTIPAWLIEGIALYKSGWPLSYAKLSHLVQTPDLLPELTHLDAIDNDDCLGFDRLNGFTIAPSLVEFIIHHWGWHAVLQLLENYAAFETILGISKETFKTTWIAFVQCHNSAVE